MGVAPSEMAAIEDVSGPAPPEVTQGRSVSAPGYPPEGGQASVEMPIFGPRPTYRRTGDYRPYDSNRAFVLDPQHIPDVRKKMAHLPGFCCARNGRRR
eukprot:2642263-Alexandrium_andersonii.AAC.1